jgi:hypothetical protein
MIRWSAERFQKGFLATGLVRCLAPDYALLAYIVMASLEDICWTGTGLVRCSVQRGIGSSGVVGFFCGVQKASFWSGGIYTPLSQAWRLSCHLEQLVTHIGEQRRAQG